MSEHACSFEIIERGPYNSWQTWLATCGCGERWSGANYAIAEDKWRMHVHATTGRLIQFVGETDGRWTP